MTQSSATAPDSESTAEWPTASSEQLDRTFAILKNRRRRLVLEYLRAHESTTHAGLARHIAAVENDVPESAVTSTQRKRVYVSLYQAHLPKLDEFDAFDFDRNRGTVERTPRTDELLRYLDRFEESESRLDDVLCPCGTLLLAGALGIVVVRGLGLIPVEPALGLTVVLSAGGVGAVAYGARY